MLNLVSPLRLPPPPQQYKANCGLSPNATQQREGVEFTSSLKEPIRLFIEANTSLIKPVLKLLKDLTENKDSFTATLVHGGDNPDYESRVEMILDGKFESEDAFSRLPKELQDKLLNKEFPLSVSQNMERARILVTLDSEGTPNTLEKQKIETLDLIRQVRKANRPPITLEQDQEIQEGLNRIFPNNETT